MVFDLQCAMFVQSNTAWTPVLSGTNCSLEGNMVNNNSVVFHVNFFIQRKNEQCSVNNGGTCP
jgi:hypothetical protein